MKGATSSTKSSVVETEDDNYTKLPDVVSISDYTKNPFVLGVLDYTENPFVLAN